MDRLWKLMLIICFTFYVTSYEDKFEMNHRQHLSLFERFRHPLEPNRKAWLDARNYIQKSFNSYDLLTDEQDFKSQVASPENSVLEVNGKNLIGHSASPDENAPVILVGTYYDNTLKRNPLAENGVSVASLLETARIFQSFKQQNKFHQNTTVLFVTFDLNVNNYSPLTPGNCGSYFFAKEWLPQYLKGRKFIGALILGSISNFTAGIHSQDLLNGYQELLPGENENVTEFKGSYLAMMSIDNDPNKKFTDSFEANYAEVKSDLNLVELLLSDEAKIKELGLLGDKIKRGPQYDFWTNSPPFPAMLLTDIDVIKKDFNADNFDKYTLDVFWSGKRRSFVETTTASVVQTLLNYQTVKEEIPNNTDILVTSEAPTTSNIQVPSEAPTTSNVQVTSEAPTTSNEPVTSKAPTTSNLSVSSDKPVTPLTENKSPAIKSLDSYLAVVSLFSILVLHSIHIYCKI